MKPIGIIGAMDVEVEHLVNCLKDVRMSTHVGIDYFEGTLAGKSVVLCQCGIGKVAAGACAAIMIDVFGVGSVINTGVAGSLDNAIDVLDLVVSTDTVEYDVDATPVGYELGHVPQLDVTYYPASPGLVSHVVEVAREVEPEMGIHRGRIASGDRFVTSLAVKESITQVHHALCCEMEGAAIGHICHVAKVPYVVVRMISDKVDGSYHLDYEIFEKKAANICARLCERMVDML